MRNHAGLFVYACGAVQGNGLTGLLVVLDKGMKAPDSLCQVEPKVEGVGVNK